MTSHVLINSIFVLVNLVDGHCFPTNGTVICFFGFERRIYVECIVHCWYQINHCFCLEGPQNDQRKEKH